MKYRWVDPRLLLLLHDESLAEHGGSSGIRDQGLLESALGRPLNLLDYATPDVFDLAASYAFGLAKNHPFVDGNKRAAFLAVGIFLGLTGYRLTAPQADATLRVLALAAGECSETQFAAWLHRESKKR
jgi:death on curing protein